MKLPVKRCLLLGFLGYGALLTILLLCETASPDASIRTLWDAVWYSLITLSTVGYGDLYPVTLPGRLVGMCFALMSLGVLAMVVGAAVNFLTGVMLPKFRLRLLRGKPWYLFSEANDASLTLAAQLAEAQPDAMCLFPMEQVPLLPDHPRFLGYPESMEQAAGDKTHSCSLFYLDENGGNYARALAAARKGHRVYCRSRLVPAVDVPNLTLFNRYACCAREYWQARPLAADETTLVLLGRGEYARELLEQALLVNVFPGSRCIQYHVFGDWTDFRHSHPGLHQTLSVNSLSETSDSLLFHEGDWNRDAALLYNADRIILCGDEDSAVLDLLTRLRRYFPTRGKVHVRSGRPIPGEQVFGSLDEVYTLDAVMGHRQSRIARMMHDIYAEGSGGTAPAWGALSPFLHQSNMAAADHLLTKVRYLLEDDSITELTRDSCTAACAAYMAARETHPDVYREAEHRRWMRFHSLYNWQYAPVRDNTARLHPLMVDYDKLPPAEQVKDDYAWELIGTIAERL